MVVLPVVKDGSLVSGDNKDEVVEAPCEANMPPVKLARVLDRDPLGAGDGLAGPGVVAACPPGTEPAPRPVPAALMLLLDPQYSTTGALSASLAASNASWKRLHRSSRICSMNFVWIKMKRSMRLSHILSATSSASWA